MSPYGSLLIVINFNKNRQQCIRATLEAIVSESRRPLQSMFEYTQVHQKFFWSAAEHGCGRISSHQIGQLLN